MRRRLVVVSQFRWIIRVSEHEDDAMRREIVVIVCAVAGCAHTARVDESKVVDLTYAFDDQTVYWPTANRFDLTPVARGRTEAGYWYASNDFCASEHGGTHLDAPIHFAEGGQSTADVPLHRLMGPAAVVDIREQCSANPNYLLTPDDILAHENRHGRLEPGTIVLIHTGYGQYYPDAERYLGSSERGTAEHLSFPGIGESAARLLVERRVDLVGLDTASLDHGPSRDFIAHRVLSKANIPGVENVANLASLPARGATVIALPMKIKGGTGGPCRVIAILP